MMEVVAISPKLQRDQIALPSDGWFEVRFFRKATSIAQVDMNTAGVANQSAAPALL